MPKPKQLQLFVTTKRGKVKPNKRIPHIKENIRRAKLAAAFERHRAKISAVSVKIRAYGLAWQLINSGRLRARSDLLEEAWWIAKKLSPAKGNNKVGRGAKFKRVFGATSDRLLGLEVKKLKLRFAERFVGDAEEFLKSEGIPPIQHGFH